MAGNNSQGSDGYPVKFYKIVNKSNWYQFLSNVCKLSDSQSKGIISLIPREGKVIANRLQNKTNCS